MHYVACEFACAVRSMDAQTQIISANALNTKGKDEFIHLCRSRSTNTIQNEKLRFQKKKLKNLNCKFLTNKRFA